MSALSTQIRTLLTTIPITELPDGWYDQNVKPILDRLDAVDALPDPNEVALAKLTMHDLIERAADALIWCSAASDFMPEGKAHEGWKSGPAALLEEMLPLRRKLDPRPLTEEENHHLTWYDVRPKSPEELASFVRSLLRDYSHDYGTIVHAAAAAALAAVHTVNADEAQGGVTGFQAGAIAHLFMRKFLQIDGPMRIREVRKMLYPHYKDEFGTIDAKTFAWLQDRARELLSERTDASEACRAHWQSIVDGTVPFGYRVKD